MTSKPIITRQFTVNRRLTLTHKVRLERTGTEEEEDYDFFSHHVTYNDGDGDGDDDDLLFKVSCAAHSAVTIITGTHAELCLTAASLLLLPVPHERS